MDREAARARGYARKRNARPAPKAKASNTEKAMKPAICAVDGIGRLGEGGQRSAPTGPRPWSTKPTIAPTSVATIALVFMVRAN